MPSTIWGLVRGRDYTMGMDMYFREKGHNFMTSPQGLTAEDNQALLGRYVQTVGVRGITPHPFVAQTLPESFGEALTWAYVGFRVVGGVVYEHSARQP
ncbi:hypothetical protein [Streptomyces humi]